MGRREVVVALLELFQVLLEGLAVLFVHKAILDVDFIEEANHVLGLVLGIVDFFDAVENNYQDDLMGHDARVLQKIPITLLDALYCRLQHVLCLRVHAHAYR